MNKGKLTSILVVADQSAADPALLGKAILLASRSGARIHLFSCDAALAYTLRHSYDQHPVQRATQSSISTHRAYLEGLRTSVQDCGVEVTIDAVCDSPHYEAILRKVASIHPDLVMKNAAVTHRSRPFTLDSNDWQLMRACPVTMMLVRGNPWRQRPRFAALVDVSNHETPRLADAIVAVSESLVWGYNGQLDIVYTERGDHDDAPSNRSCLEDLTRRNGIPPDHVYVLNGDPDTALPDFARKGRYDALVLGALTHRPGLAALLGTLTGRLVDTLDCDFILVKPAAVRGHCAARLQVGTPRALAQEPPLPAAVRQLLQHREKSRA